MDGAGDIVEERAFSAIGGDLMMYDDRDELAILGA